MIELQGTRVALRPLRSDDVDELYRQRVASTHMISTPDKDVLRRRVEHSGEWHEGRLDLAIESDGRLAGSIEARTSQTALPPGVCELGIELEIRERGRGLGAEAIELLTDWLLDNGFERVQASTDVTNAPMRRVFEKLGWEHEGTLRAFMPASGGRADYAMYATTRRSRPRPAR
ncbi:MAG TPA: GNAT family protein [Gaiellaceae bacterium]|nr:GNAT family protein [Gaiellaceae bacterium]